MNISLEINGVDRTSNVVWNSLQKSDVINDKTDNLSFSVNRYANLTFEPKVNDTVELFDEGDTIYKGLILTVNKSTEGHTVVRYDVDCVDNTHLLNKVLVVESYVNTTISEIIADIVSNYAPEFTVTGVDSDIPVESVTFNRISVSEALQKLSRLSNYSWYVDYDNDIHFFARNTEPAPFSITDTSANYIFESLEVSDDISQLRNRVTLQGGEAEGEPRTEKFNGDGVKTFFKLSNKFSAIYDNDHNQILTVAVGGSNKTIGVDFLDKEEDFDVLWNYNEQYLKFTDAPPSGTNNIEVTGIPLYSILVQVEDADSISEYGVHEFAKTDTSISSKQEAKDFAIAELEAYANKISEGSFTTYTPGLRSGQLISVNSALRGIDEDFLIQKVTFQMVSQTTGMYKVDLATLKTVTLVDILINQLRANGNIKDNENVLLQKFIPIKENIILSDSVTVQPLNYPVVARVGPQAVSGYIRPFILNGSFLS